MEEGEDDDAVGSAWRRTKGEEKEDVDRRPLLITARSTSDRRTAEVDDISMMTRIMCLWNDGWALIKKKLTSRKRTTGVTQKTQKMIKNNREARAMGK